MTLDDFQKYFDTSYAEFVAKEAIQDNQIQEDTGYEKLTGLTRVELEDGKHFFFKENRLQLIYISGGELPREIWNELLADPTKSEPGARVRSRAGKTANQLIFASRGITVSVAKDEIHFIEIYPPCSVKSYLESIYEEPSAFIR